MFHTISFPYSIWLCWNPLVSCLGLKIMGNLHISSTRKQSCSWAKDISELIDWSPTSPFPQTGQVSIISLHEQSLHMISITAVARAHTWERYASPKLIIFRRFAQSFSCWYFMWLTWAHACIMGWWIGPAHQDPWVIGISLFEYFCLHYEPSILYCVLGIWNKGTP